MNEYKFLFNRAIVYIDNKGLSAVMQLTPTAIVLAASDGPIPVGDVLAVSLLATAAVVDAVTPGPGTGDCARAVHRVLQNAVDAAKKTTRLLGGCNEKEYCWTLKIKKKAWLALATARSIINKKCFRGGDSGHSQAEADAWTNVGKCERAIQCRCK